jgi:hypothetical protein
LPSSSFDFRSLNRFFTSQASDDLNRFLEKMPQNAGNAVLIAAGIAWASAAAFGLFAMMQTKQLTELKAELQTTEALKPIVPTLKMVDISKDELTALVTSLKAVYTGMLVTSTGSTLTIQSRDTAQFPQFRELLGQVANGGVGWKVSIDSFCVGRECAQNSLEAKLKIQKMQIEKPVAATE